MTAPDPMKIGDFVFKYNNSYLGIHDSIAQDTFNAVNTLKRIACDNDIPFWEVVEVDMPKDNYLLVNEEGFLLLSRDKVITYGQPTDCIGASILGQPTWTSKGV